MEVVRSYAAEMSFLVLNQWEETVTTSDKPRSHVHHDERLVEISCMLTGLIT